MATRLRLVSHLALNIHLYPLPLIFIPTTLFNEKHRVERKNGKTATGLETCGRFWARFRDIVELEEAWARVKTVLKEYRDWIRECCDLTRFSVRSWGRTRGPYEGRVGSRYTWARKNEATPWM
jgi:hypothetical protein